MNSQKYCFKRRQAKPDNDSAVVYVPWMCEALDLISFIQLEKHKIQKIGCETWHNSDVGEIIKLIHTYFQSIRPWGMMPLGAQTELPPLWRKFWLPNLHSADLEFHCSPLFQTFPGNGKPCHGWHDINPSQVQIQSSSKPSSWSSSLSLVSALQKQRKLVMSIFSPSTSQPVIENVSSHRAGKMRNNRRNGLSPAHGSQSYRRTGTGLLSRYQMNYAGILSFSTQSFMILFQFWKCSVQAGWQKGH